MVANPEVVTPEEARLKKALFAVILGLTVLPGCSFQPPLYRWGEYQSVLTEMYAEDSDNDVAAQVVRLSQDLERTLAEGKRVPPGVHAHLGYLYYTQGDTQAAASHFTSEKELFPESTVFIDGILKRLRSKR